MCVPMCFVISKALTTLVMKHRRDSREPQNSMTNFSLFDSCLQLEEYSEYIFFVKLT